MPHPLDRPVWNTLTGAHAALAEGNGRAVRYRAEVNLFGAAADRSPESLAALGRLVPDDGELGMVEAEAWPSPPGGTVVSEATIDQMVAEGSPTLDAELSYDHLAPADGPDIFALASLCKPGPFKTESWRMGDFIGLRDGRRLIAMAGRRWRVPGFIEVSAVCTHPDARGRGLAGKLIAAQMARIDAEGARTFLHVYPDNLGAIRLYESLGFAKRAEMRFTVLTRG